MAETNSTEHANAICDQFGKIIGEKPIDLLSMYRCAVETVSILEAMAGAIMREAESDRPSNITMKCLADGIKQLASEASNSHECNIEDRLDSLESAGIDVTTLKRRVA